MAPPTLQRGSAHAWAIVSLINLPFPTKEKQIAIVNMTFYYIYNIKDWNKSLKKKIDLLKQSLFFSQRFTEITKSILYP